MRKVLVVDDVSINREILKKMLSAEYDILEAENGEEAMQILHRNYKLFSAVVLDLLMPVMDGYEVLRRMHDNAALAQIPVIVVTGSSEDDARVRALALGANDFVTKPFHPDIIRHCLHNNIVLRETATIVNVLKNDKLTGVLCREAFFEMVAAHVKGEPPDSFWVISYDVDNFKLVNDQFGAAEGDRILKYIASSTQAAFAAVNGFCGRISGDNFAGLCPNSPTALARIEACISKLAPQDAPTTLSFRIGRYLIHDPNLAVSAMYDRAYIAKLSIKGLYDRRVASFNETMLATLVQEQRVITEMGDALATEQFEVWFQPQINHATKALVGAEALVRWRHPSRGLISPASFIPIFEQNGFIYEMDKFVWRQVCVLLRQWMDEGRNPLPISINISRYDVFREDFITILIGYVQEFAIPCDLLRLEITESAFAKSTSQIISVVKQLMNFGFIIEIDDFGSGYSSLNTLKDVPADVLKLDMRFLEKEGDSERSGNILESVVRMAKWLGMSVIAEGVEKVQQADFLKSIGCNYVQGYLYAKPMPVSEYEHYAVGIGKEEKMLSLETVETFDNNSFWNSESMDTLIFNSYIGGACILELHNDSLEMLRATDKFATVLGGAQMTVETVLKLDWTECMEPESYARVVADIHASYQSKEERVAEYVFHHLPGCPGRVFLRSTIRVIASTGNRLMVYSMSENITAQREAEKKQRETAEQMAAMMANINGGVTASIVKDGNVRFLFANDQYYAQLGYTKEQFMAEVPDCFALVHPDDRAKVLAQANFFSKEFRPYAIRYRVRRRDGETRWMVSNISVMHYPDVEEPVQLAVASDITEQRHAEQQLRDTDEQLHFLNALAHHLLAEPDTEQGILDLLARLQQYFGSARTLILEVNRSHQTFESSYEMCAEGVKSVKNIIQQKDFDVMLPFLDAVERQGFVNIPDVGSLPERYPEKQLFQQQDVRSLVAVPLMREGELIGVIAVVNPDTKKVQIDRLVAVGDFVAVMLTRRDYDRKVTSDSEMMKTFMDDTPGGFCRMQLMPDGQTMKLIYFNEGFCQLVNTERETVTRYLKGDALGGIHPDDLSKVWRVAKESVTNGGHFSVKCRLRSGVDRFTWVLLNGRFVQANDGTVFLNAYYSDITRQVEKDRQLRELLDNLPYGVALFVLDGNALTALQINKRYWELVQRPRPEMPYANVMDAVHPEDREKAWQELQTAKQQTRDAVCDLRIRSGNGVYQRLHVVGRMTKRSDGKDALYVAYSLLSEQALTRQEAIPFVLSTIMASSNDLSFAKDRDYRYLCCSRTFAHRLGLSHEQDVIGKTDFELFPPEIAEKYRRDDERLMREQHALVDMVESIPSDTGSPRYARTSKYPLHDAAGDIIGLYGCGQDITENREVFAQLKLLTDSIPGGVVTHICTPQGIRVSSFTDGFCALLGYTRAEYTVQSASSASGCVVPEDLPIIRERLAALIADDVTVSCVYRIRTKAGSLKWVQHRAVATDRSGEIVVINSVLLDVTNDHLAARQTADGVGKERSHDE